jgi:hypothetical protein
VSKRPRTKLLRFNPLIAKAFTQFESENDPRTADVMREIVIAALKTGADPEKIYATIKTGRMGHSGRPRWEVLDC